MDDESLILLVQAHDLIYNKRNPNYKIPELKKKAWREIANNLGVSEEMCAKRWTTLRDRYVKEKRQDSLPSGSGSMLKYTWPLMKCMEFLAPHIVPRPVRGSFNIVSEFSPVSPSSESSSPVVCTTDPMELLLNTSVTPVVNDEVTETQVIGTPTSLGNEGIRRKRKSTNVTDADAVFADAVDAFKKFCDKDNDKNNALRGFGDMIVSTIATMSSVKQVEAMKRVTNLVMEMKIEDETTLN